MAIRSLWVISLASATLVCLGCNGGRLSFSYHDHKPVRRTHVHRHVCDHDCHHHYYDGTNLVVLKGHRHGPGCGHFWDGSRWVISKVAAVRPAHPKTTASKSKAPPKVTKTHKARTGKAEKAKTRKLDHPHHTP